MKINILSLFGWIECGRVAIDRLWWEVGKYFSSEIDPYAIKQTKINYPDIIHIGSVTGLKYEDGALFYNQDNDPLKNGGSYIANIDLLIGWSPCQDLSTAKANGKGLNGEKSGLFYEFLRILHEVKPKYFLLENVASMKKADRDEITRLMWVEPILINSSLVSAQNRKRLYWTNIPWVTQPEDKGILLKDILEDIPQDDQRWKPLDEKYLNKKTKLLLREKSYSLTATYAWACPRDYIEKSSRQLALWQFRRTNLRVHSEQEKTCTLTANMGTGGNNVPIIIEDKSPSYFWRKLTPIECERLQTLTEVKKRIQYRIYPFWNTIWSENQKINASAETQSHKLQNVVGNAENTNKQEIVKYAEKNTSQKYQKTNAPVRLNVLINLEDQKPLLQIQYEWELYAQYAEKQKEYPRQNQIENIVPLSVELLENLERIALNGSDELQKNTKLSIVQENGSYVVGIYGQNIEDIVKDAEIKQHQKPKNATTSIISKLSGNTENLNLIDEILRYFVKSVIDSCTQNSISIKNLYEINFEFSRWYTFWLSNSRRYKAIGNWWTVDVIAHILSFIPGLWK